MSTNHVTIAASPDVVFEVLTDAFAFREWVVGAKEVRAVDESWPEPGSRFFHTVGAPGLDIQDTSKILEVEQERRLVLEARFRPSEPGLVELELEGAEDSTRVTMVEWPRCGSARTWPLIPRELAATVRNQISLLRLARLCQRRRDRDDGTASA